MDRAIIYEQILQGFLEAGRRCRQRSFSADLQALDLTMAQMKAIWFLQQGPSHMSKIAAALGVALPSTTATIDRLVVRGLVKRREDLADRRLVVCSLTEQGEAFAGSFEELQRTTFKELLSNLDESELETVLKAVSILAGTVDRESRDLWNVEAPALS